MTVSDLIIKVLEEQGIEYCFALPGEENLHFLESLRTSTIKLIVTRHEQAAAFMAATYGRLTGRPGLCLSTLGPGAMNLVNGVAYAQLGGMPLIAITGQKAAVDNWQAQFQMVDTVGVMRPITKWATSLTTPSQTLRTVYHALSVATADRPGAVHLEIPEDVAGFDYNGPLPPFTPEPAQPPIASDAAITRAAELIKNAKKPIVIVSSGGNRARITPALEQFVADTNLYVISTQLGKGSLPDDNSHSLFTLGLHKQDYVHRAINDSDLLITIGFHTNEHAPAVWNKKRDKHILHIDSTIAEPDEYYIPTAQVIGDISASLTTLGSALKQTPASYDLSGLRSELLIKYKENTDNSSYPLFPQRIVNDIRAVMGREDVVTLDNGIYKLWFARHYQTFANNTLLLDNTLATMGAGLPSAMAIKLLQPDKKVLAVCGDGGFMMNSQEMITCVKEHIPVVVLILNDNAYGFIEWKQRNMSLPEFAMKLDNPDFVKYAESYGALGLRVESADDLIPKLHQAFASGRPALVECPIDYSENYRVFIDELNKLR